MLEISLTSVLWWVSHIYCMPIKCPNGTANLLSYPLNADKQYLIFVGVPCLDRDASNKFLNSCLWSKAVGIDLIVVTSRIQASTRNFLLQHAPSIIIKGRYRKTNMDRPLHSCHSLLYTMFKLLLLICYKLTQIWKWIST